MDRHKATVLGIGGGHFSRPIWTSGSNSLLNRLTVTIWIWLVEGIQNKLAKHRNEPTTQFSLNVPKGR